MKQDRITVHVKMDAKIYKRFSYFDTFALRKRWRSPFTFAGILLVFAIICFAVRAEQSVMAGLVLAIVGLGLPVVYIASFVSSVRLQAVQLKLEKPRPAYTVTIGQTLRIENDARKEPAQELAWEKVFGVWQGKGAIYLYATAAKAFILPDGQADAEPA